MMTVLTIAGSDPSGGAGIQADQRVIEAHGHAVLSVSTALTAQNTNGVDAVYPVDADVLRHQLRTLLSDIRPDAVKIGMLGSAAQVDAVADILTEYALDNIVLDPVLASTAGVPLLDDAGIDVLLRRLMPLATVITPNLHEAERLSGVPSDQAAAKLISMGARAVLLKGGHLDGAPIDTLTFTADSNVTSPSPIPMGEGAGGEGPHVDARPPTSTRAFPGHRIDTPHTHGTGCFLSSAIASNLALDISLQDSIANAKVALNQALTTPTIVGQGRGYPSIRAFAVSAGPRQLDTPLPARNERRGRGAGGEGIAGLYVLTDPTLRPDRSAVDTVAAALAGGARIIQMRDKNGSTPELIDLARKLRKMCREARALFFVNDRVDIALACEADGVHLGPDDMSPIDARSLVGHTMAIGVSVSTVEEAAPLAPYVDYFGVGAIFGSSTKLDAGAAVGVDRIRQIKAAFPHHPLVAIGGIDASNIADVIDAGADSVAVISAVLCAVDMVDATRNLVSAFPNR